MSLSGPGRLEAADAWKQKLALHGLQCLDDPMPLERQAERDLENAMPLERPPVPPVRLNTGDPMPPGRQPGSEVEDDDVFSIPSVIWESCHEDCLDTPLHSISVM